MRNILENPFIANECRRLGIERAPIKTNILETYAQCNEDLLVEAMLRAQTRRAGREMSTIRYIEIGANHPIQTSSTYLLHKLYGASGVLVEPIPALAETLKRVRPDDTVVNCLVTASLAQTADLHIYERHELSSVSADHILRFSGRGAREKPLETITCQNLHINEFLTKYVPGPVDYLSIDIEGLDIDVLIAMDLAFQPTIIQCGHEHKIDQLSLILSARGCSLLGITDVNVIFVRAGTV